MSELRTWNVGDAEPADCDAVVDDEGVTCTRVEDPHNEGLSGYYEWLRWRLTHYSGKNGQRSVVAGPELGNDWGDLLATYGPVREATSDEASLVKVELR